MAHARLALRLPDASRRHCAITVTAPDRITPTRGEHSPRPRRVARLFDRKCVLLELRERISRSAEGVGMPHPRETTVDDLNQFDIGCKIRIPRPPGEAAYPPFIIGKLLAIRPTTMHKGMMPRAAAELRLLVPGYFNNRAEVYGPFLGTHPVTVGQAWVERPSRWERERAAQEARDAARSRDEAYLDREKERRDRKQGVTWSTDWHKRA